jgi:hypothetical protein
MNRRNFINTSALTGAGALTSGLMRGLMEAADKE